MSFVFDYKAVTSISGQTNHCIAKTAGLFNMNTHQPFNILIFSKTSGYRHTSIPSAVSSISNLAACTKLFTVDTSEDATIFTPSSLSQYSVIVLLQSIGDIFDQSQLNALKGFVRRGGGIVGIHGAAAGMPDSEWYGRLIGAHFDMHPPAEVGTLIVETPNQDHCILNGAGGREGWKDEWYNFHAHPRENANLKILLKGDTKSFRGGKMGEDHPLVWCQEFEGGRSFFTALGHFNEAYQDDWYMNQVLSGILWAARREAATEMKGEQGI
jgi:type 1 glutamine amidotransferase